MPSHDEKGNLGNDDGLHHGLWQGAAPYDTIGVQRYPEAVPELVRTKFSESPARMHFQISYPLQNGFAEVHSGTL
jgi:hypothetical protein